MKPQTYKQLCDDFLENHRNAQTCEEDGMYDELQTTNETIQYFMFLEGKKTEFSKWEKRVYVQVQVEEDNA